MSGETLEQPEDTRPPHRARPVWRILLLSGGMLVFLALVAAASRAHHVPGSSAGVHSPPAGVGDYLFTMFLLVVVVGFLFLIYIWFSERDLLAQAHRGRQKKGTYRALILIFLFLALFPVLRNRFHILQHPQKTAQQTVHGGKRKHGKHGKPTQPAKHRPP